MNKIDDATELILSVFRLNGALLEAGNELVGCVGLSSARWQVLGVLAMNERSMTVSQIAKDMGLSRQAVQQTCNGLMQSDFLEAQTNPYHKVAKLMELTPKGKKAYEEAMALYRPWVTKLTEAFSLENIACAREVVRGLQKRLETKQYGSIRK